MSVVPVMPHWYVLAAHRLGTEHDVGQDADRASRGRIGCLRQLTRALVIECFCRVGLRPPRPTRQLGAVSVGPRPIRTSSDRRERGCGGFYIPKGCTIAPVKHRARRAVPPQDKRVADGGHSWLLLADGIGLDASRPPGVSDRLFIDVRFKMIRTVCDVCSL